MSDKTYNLGLKVPMTMIERLDALVSDVEAEYQHLQAAGLIRKVSRSTVARLVMDAGLDALETRYWTTSSKPLPDPSPGAHKVEAAEPDDTDPASAFLRSYQKPSRMVKPATATAARLREWRQGQGLNQVKAAELLGMGQSSYSALETGKRLPTPAQAAKLAELAGIAPDAWTAAVEGRRVREEEPRTRPRKRAARGGAGEEGVGNE